MSFQIKAGHSLNSYITKMFILALSFNIISIVGSTSTGIIGKNSIVHTNSFYNQTINNKFVDFIGFNQRAADDSATIYYNLAWTAYKNSNFNNARYYWEKGSLCNTINPDKYNCLFRLGLLQQVGEGVDVNLESAFNFYMKASKNGKPGGNVDATKNIGTFYENGMFVPKDNKKALEWYLKAKEQGNRYCDDDIARVKKNMYDLFQDLNK